MSDWQPGDLALCVKHGPWLGLFTRALESDGPKAGQIHVVTGVHDGDFLVLERFGRRGWAQEQFRKVTPGADIQGIEAEKRRKVPA